MGLQTSTAPSSHLAQTNSIPTSTTGLGNLAINIYHLAIGGIMRSHHILTHIIVSLKK